MSRMARSTCGSMLQEKSRWRLGLEVEAGATAILASMDLTSYSLEYSRRPSAKVTILWLRILIMNAGLAGISCRKHEASSATTAR